MKSKLFLLLCLILSMTHVTKSNEEAEEAPAEDAEAEAEGEADEAESGEDPDSDEEEAEAEAEEQAEEGAAEELKCNQAILATYGMVGLESAKPMALDMCESVKHSCCQVTDQLKIFENWVQNGEDEDLGERLKYQSRVGFCFVLMKGVSHDLQRIE